MTVRVFSDDLCISEEEIQDSAKEVVKAIKTKLPKKYHCECIISEILLEAQKIVNRTILDL